MMTQPREPVFHYGNIQVFNDAIMLGKKKYLFEMVTSVSFKVQNTLVLKKILGVLGLIACVLAFFSLQAALCVAVAFLFVLHMYMRPRAYVILREGGRRLPLLRTYDMQAAKTLYSVLQMMVDEKQTKVEASSHTDQSL